MVERVNASWGGKINVTGSTQIYFDTDRNKGIVMKSNVHLMFRIVIILEFLEIPNSQFLFTYGVDEKLKICLYESGVPAEAGENDVLFMYIAAVDKNGNINPAYSKEISVEIEGDATVMNLDAIKAEVGIAIALVKLVISW